MDLGKIVAEKAGISEAQADLAINAVISQLSDKLPEGMGAQLASVLNGGEFDASSLLGSLGGEGGIGGMLGGMFGK
ncbi:MAG: hypothetical protein RI894_728 [Bacteroidota bacterium]|jgi:nucleoid DNA-binding protein